MSNFLTMIFVLGGTFVMGAALLYASLPHRTQLRGNGAKRSGALGTAGNRSAAPERPGEGLEPGGTLPVTRP